MKAKIINKCNLFTMLLIVMAWFIPQFGWTQTPSKPETGNGSTNNPFLISSAEELVWFSNWVNGTNFTSTHASACAKLVDNIDMNNISSWIAIGDYDNVRIFFAGVFDGNGKTISNLKSKQGIFAWTKGAYIQNFTIDNAKIDSNNDYVGILAGHTISSTISGIRIKCGHIKGCNYIAGLTGYSCDSKVDNCEIDATVEGYQEAGLIAGFIVKGNIYRNIFALGSVSSTKSNSGILFGTLNSSNAKVNVAGIVAFDKETKLISNGTELQGDEIKVIGTGSISAGFILGCSKEELKSGIVTYMLQQKNKTDGIVWGQNLSTDDGDLQPVLGSTYQVYANNEVKLNCQGTFACNGTFSNNPNEDEGYLQMVHKGTENYVEGSPATCTENGTLSHYKCSNCNSTYEDKELQNEIFDITDPAKFHNYDANDVCTLCQKQIPTVEIGINTMPLDNTEPNENKISGFNLFKFTSKSSGCIEIKKSAANFSLWDSNKSEPIYTGGLTEAPFWIIEANTVYYIGIKPINDQAIENYTFTIKSTSLPDELAGTGTKKNPFILKNAEHLKFFADYVNGTGEVTSTHFGAYAKIADDVDEIDMSSVCHPVETDNTAEVSWTPISNTTNDMDCWYGTFDGNGKTISNLYINGSQENVGLFGLINGTVKNLTLKNSIVTNTGSNTGILLGYQNIGCYIINVKTYGSINGANYAGGIVGYSKMGTVSNCENHATVAGQKYVGGIRGGSINNYSDGSFSNCSNYGQITGTDEYVGGIVGYIHGIYIGNCANYGSIKGKNRVGGIAGCTEYDYAENVLNYGDVTSTEGNVAGSLFGYVTNCKGFLAYNKEAKFTVNNQQKDANAIGSGSTGAATAMAFTKQQMKSGEVAFFLNGSKSTGNLAWYQKLGENGDAYPVLTSTGDNKVYGSFHHRATERFYTNDANVKEHSVAYNAEAENEENGNHDVSYEAGEYTWTDAEDKTQDPTVAVTYTCKVCGKKETPQMAVEHDAEHDNEAATCTEEGHNYYKTSYTFNDKAVFSDAYTQTLPALGHNMSDKVTFNDSKSIYQKGCTRDCGYHDYYATSDGGIKADANADGSTFTVEAFTLDDATAYDNKAKFTVKELTYKRTFKNNGWQAVYVPFDLNCAQIQMDKYEVATINNFHEYEQEDGSLKVELEVKRVIDYSTIPALTPCLIRKRNVTETEPARTEKLDFNEVSFVPAEDKSIDCASVTRYYQFLGSLEEKRDFDMTTDFSLVNGELWGAGQTNTLSPQRWYLKATDRYEGLLNPTAQLSRIAIRVIGEGSATGIEDIHVTTDYGTANGGKQGIYDLQGRKLDQEPESGIYIKNGKKYVK